ncbi:hypothetical protein ACHAPJ_009700 [Fusarium lateritium]
MWLSVFQYLKLDETKTKLNKIVRDIRVQFEFAESVYNNRYPDEKVQLADFWIEWITDHYAHVQKKFKSNMLDMVAEIRENLEGDESNLAKTMNGFANTFEKAVNSGVLVNIDTSGFATDGDTEMGNT